MVHDVRGSLAHLRSLVQKAVTPVSSYCVICSRGAGSLADGSKDDVMVFRYVMGGWASGKVVSSQYLDGPIQESSHGFIVREG